jgi:uncharacterized protein
MNDTIRDNTALQRFELETEGHNAVAYYRLSPDTITIFHTEVDPEISGRGVGSRLVHGVLEIVRQRGLKVVPRCSFVGNYIARHPKFKDLVK